MQRFIEILQALPLFVMALVMAAALGPSLRNTIIAISVALIPAPARVVRANTLSLREQPFVEAARAIGMSETRIAIRHVLPNTLAPLIVIVTAQIGVVMLVEAALSFLGLGVPEPHPSWGRRRRSSAAEYVRGYRALAGGLPGPGDQSRRIGGRTCLAMPCATCSIRARVTIAPPFGAVSDTPRDTARRRPAWSTAAVRGDLPVSLACGLGLRSANDDDQPVFRRHTVIFGSKDPADSSGPFFSNPDLGKRKGWFARLT